MRMAASLNRDLIESVKQHGGDAMCEWQIRTGPVALLVGAVRSRVDRMEHEAVEVQVVGCLGEAIALPVPLLHFQHCVRVDRRASTRAYCEQVELNEIEFSGGAETVSGKDCSYRGPGDVGKRTTRGGRKVLSLDC